MAVDKLVDSAQLDADLTSVANAIRTKGGTSSQMAFPAGFVSAVQAIPSGGITPTGTKSITENGTYDVTQYASASVSVPNSYGAGDEGKVVSNGALVAQSSDTVTTNNTYDTTLINSLTVNVSGGGGGAMALLDTITVAQQVRAVNVDISAYSSLYDFIYIFVDAELTASDWIYYVMNGSSPSGGTYQNSMQNHKGICFIQLHPAAGQPSNSVIAGVPASTLMSLGNQNGTPVSNVYAYTYTASKYFKAGSTFKIYGGNYADM